MQENISDLSRKYQEEMLRLYGRRKPDTVPEQPMHSTPAQEQQVHPVPVRESSLQLTPAQEEVDSSLFSPNGPQLPEADVLQDMPEAYEEFGVEEDLPDIKGEPPKYEEPVLPEYVQRQPPIFPAGWEEQAADEARNTETGKLIVVASTGDGAFPVKGASVTIFSNYGGDDKIYWLLTTNESGETPLVELPAPPASLSQSPDNVRPYAVYSIKITAEGYSGILVEEVPVFAGVTSRQGFAMIPLPLRMPQKETIVHLSTEQKEG